MSGQKTFATLPSLRTLKEVYVTQKFLPLPSSLNVRFILPLTLNGLYVTYSFMSNTEEL